MKLLVFVLLVTLASAQWREGRWDPDNCPVPNGDFPTLFRGATCAEFYKCNDGWACK